MRPFLAHDLAEVFIYDMTSIVQYKGKSYTVLVSDRQVSEVDELGGPMPIDPNEYHFQTTDLAEIENGDFIFDDGAKQIVVSSTTSGDGNELIVKTRAA